MTTSGHIIRPGPSQPVPPERICNWPFACDCPRCDDDDSPPPATTKKAA